jgi:hypothetical protein
MQMYSSRKHATSAPATPHAATRKTSWKAKNAERNAAVFQIVWTVYAIGRKFLVVFHMVCECLTS